MTFIILLHRHVNPDPFYEPLPVAKITEMNTDYSLITWNAILMQNICTLSAILAFMRTATLEILGKKISGDIWSLSVDIHWNQNHEKQWAD